MQRPDASNLYSGICIIRLATLSRKNIFGLFFSWVPLQISSQFKEAETEAQRGPTKRVPQNLTAFVHCTASEKEQIASPSA